ncbi:F-box/LRR-repeat protein-like protein isoform X1 [Salvia divinorum]|uniref:F-box/LRR-repeat protein-like protein isoform X1 n=1 Tax=Salvia divinorum TaxID=28513 RepID=A0ABD1FRP8_SALDI
MKEQKRINANYYSLLHYSNIQHLDLIFITYLKNKCYHFPYKQGFPDDLKLLKKLSLRSVDVSGEAVSFLLGNCRLLEQLSLCATNTLSSLKIVRTSPSFKCLEIIHRRSLKSIVICESGLVCIKYAGERCKFVLVDAPLLTQLWILGASHPCYDSASMEGILGMFSSLLPQLHMLKIYAKFEYEHRNTLPLMMMSNLKELVLVLGSDYCDKWSLVQAINWFSWTPCLQRFVVELLRHCAAIDKIIIDPRSFKLHDYMPWEYISLNQMEDHIFARNRAKDQLGHYPLVNIL